MKQHNNTKLWQTFLKFSWFKLSLFFILLIIIPLFALGGIWSKCSLSGTLSGIGRPESPICTISAITLRTLWPALFLTNNQSSIIISVIGILVQLIYTWIISSVIITLFKRFKKK